MNGSVSQFKLAANVLAKLCIQGNPPPKKAKQSPVIVCDDHLWGPLIVSQQQLQLDKIELRLNGGRTLKTCWWSENGFWITIKY